MSLPRCHGDEAQPDLFSWAWRISWREQLWLLTLTVLVFPLSMAPLALQRRMINHAIDHAGVDLLLYYGALYLGAVLLQGGLKCILQVRRERVGNEPCSGCGGGSSRRGSSRRGPASVRAGQPKGRSSRWSRTRRAGRRPGIEQCDEHEQHIKRIFDSRISYVRVKYLLKSLTNLFNHLAPLSVLVIGGWFVIQGRTELGTVVAFITGFERMADPVRQLLAHYRVESETRVKYRLLAKHFRL